MSRGGAVAPGARGDGEDVLVGRAGQTVRLLLGDHSVDTSPCSNTENRGSSPSTSASSTL